MTIKNTTPKYKTKDEGCPTCGSMDFAITEIINSNEIIETKLKCHNCKKFWYKN
jgi:hypothetical protein